MDANGERAGYDSKKIGFVMGDQDITRQPQDHERRAFMKSLLNEVRAMALMLEKGHFESGMRRIGAEQEMFLVDHSHLPSWRADETLAQIGDPRFTHELGKFNLEANLSPLTFGNNCLSTMEQELQEVYDLARNAASKNNDQIALVGILPTLGRRELTLDAMLPQPRYFALNEALLKLRGSDFQINIKGIDELRLSVDNLMLEACNTSFQVHFQVDPENFSHLYNIAQAVTGPLLASCVNSPILLGKRLWHESRIAVFEHSVDTRSDAHAARGLKPRVHFGDHWVENSVAEIFKEDIARFRVILTCNTEDDPVGMVQRGEVPKLRALCLHNGTVYRWNRACYGISDNGKPHLRIENRVIPSGPTVIDAVANSALYFGLMAGLSDEIEDIRDHISFADVKTNFIAAARDGIRAQQVWFNEQQLPAHELILEKLLPIARRGLTKTGIDQADIDRYLGVIEQRVTKRRTGARWLLESMQELEGKGSHDECLRSLTASMIQQQATGVPVHEWKLAEFSQQQDWRDSYRTVHQFMATDLFTVQPDDIVDFAASLMDWRHIRHVPVEDDTGQLLGLVSHRSILRLIADGESSEPTCVRDIMHTELVTVEPGTRTVDAIRTMRENKLSCLLVVKNGKLLGLVTEHDLLKVASRLLESYLE